MLEVIELVQNLSFPIACVLGCGFFIKYMYDENNKNTKDFINSYDANTRAIESLKDALNDSMKGGNKN